MVKKVATTFILSVIFFSCAKVGFREDWDLQLNNIEQGKLKLYGYYYRGDTNLIIAPIFIYNNGLICQIKNEFERNNNLNAFAVFEEFLNKNVDIENYFNDEPNWGIIEINSSKITWQYRRYDFNYGTYRHADVLEGEILNDTTFVLKEKYRLKRGRKKDIEKLKTPLIYKFRYFSVKPDSINPFVKW